MGKFETDGAVTLYYDNAAKLATTSTGVNVTGTVTADGLTVDTNTLHVDATNNRVGIGTTSPTDRLNISSGSNQIGLDTGDQAAYGTLDLGHFTNGAFIGTQAGSNAASNLLRFGTGGTERMRLDSDGNVGIGTSAPAARLSFGSYIPSDGQTIHTYHSGTTRSGLGIVSGQHRMFTSTGATLGFGHVSTTDGSTFTERMRVDSSGNLLIGTNTTSAIDTPGYRFIPGAAGYSEFARTANDGSANIYLSRGNDGRMLAFYRVDGGNTQVGSITVTSSATSYNTSSDYRLKENVVDLTGATERLKQLKPKRFNFIADADKTIDGFLAHEAQAVVPEAVSGEKDAMIEEVLYVDGDEIPEGKKVGDVKTASTIDPQGIDQSKLVPLLVATIKELEARITTLEAN
jgi:hypothetical protein